MLRGAHPATATATSWVVRYRQHLAARDGHPEHLLDPVAAAEREVRADRVVLAAGTFGSTRPAAAQPRRAARASARAWARGFSGNGDLLLFLRGADRYLDPATGPVITASVRVPDASSPSGRGCPRPGRGRAGVLGVAVAGPRDARRPVAPALPARARLAARLRGGLAGHSLVADALGDAHGSAAMLPLLGMGRDVPGGRMDAARRRRCA